MKNSSRLMFENNNKLFVPLIYFPKSFPKNRKQFGTVIISKDNNRCCLQQQVPTKQFKTIEEYDSKINALRIYDLISKKSDFSFSAIKFIVLAPIQKISVYISYNCCFMGGSTRKISPNTQVMSSEYALLLKTGSLS